MDRVKAILEGIRPDVEFDKETALIDDGILDSFDIIAIVTDLNDEFDIEIVPNVKLSDVVSKTEYGDISELDTIISFGIFSKDFKKIILLINLSNNDVVRSVCRKSKIGYMEVNSYSLTDLKHIKSRISKALSK